MNMTLHRFITVALILGLLTPTARAAEPRRRASRGPLTLRELQKKLRKVYASKVAKMGTFSVYIKQLGGPTLFARHSGSRLHPASCVKLITSAAALRKLGADYRFDTVLRGRHKQGTMSTPLYLWGQGDPTLNREDLKRFAARVKGLGIRAIPKGIVVDDSYYDGRRWPPGFRTPSSSSYMTPTGAVSLDGNTVEVVITPTVAGERAQILLLPQSAYLITKNLVKTGERTRLNVYASRHGKDLRVVVSGTIKAGAEPARKWVRVLDPARYAGETLKAELLAQGLTVGAVVRAKLPAGTPLPELLRHRSKVLKELVRAMNKRSNNFYAEQLLKALGAKASGRPGSTAKGVKATRGLLTRSGIRPRSYQLANGSGLFGTTRITSKHLVRLLSRLHTLPWLYQAIRDSLPIGGVDGTLAKRMGGTAAAGRVRAKTGTFNKVSCLAGYVDGPKRRKPIVFAIIHNGFTTSHRRVRKVQDRMMVLIARYQLRR